MNGGRMQEQTKNRAILNRFEQWSCPINPVRAWPVMGMRRTCSHPGLSIHARSRASSTGAGEFDGTSTESVDVVGDGGPY